jgi:predicted RNA-binding protein YlqC (UPF0109 family)
MAASIDEQFIEYIVKSLVNNPDAVKIKRTIDEKGVLLELEVDPEDLGRVIGKRGATAQSLRTLLRALGTKNDARYNLKIVDTGGPGSKPAPRRDHDDDDAPQDDTQQPADKPADEPAEEEVVDDEVTEEESVTTDDTSDVISRTREELAELDDLDV